MHRSTSLPFLLCWWRLIAFLLTNGVQGLSYYDNAEGITVLKSYNTFEREILNGKGIWLVQICEEDNDACDQYSRLYGSLAYLMNGIFGVAVIDRGSTAGQRMATHFGNPTTIPAVYMIGDDKQNPIAVETKDDVGQKLLVFTSQTIQKRAEKFYIGGEKGDSSSSPSSRKNRGSSSKKSHVLQVDSSNFEQHVLNNPQVVAVAFTATWCGHCQRLLPEWEQAAQRLAGAGAVLAWVDAEANRALASQYKVQGFPTIRIFPGGSPKSALDARPYEGERTAAALVRALMEEVDRSGVPAEIGELTGPDVLKEHCAGHNHICVLAALPHILESGAQGRNKYRDLIAIVAKKFRGDAFTFLWFEGSSQPDMEQAFGLSFGFPAVVAFSMDRQAYGVLHGSFTDKSITSFLHGITAGSQPIAKLPQLPTLRSVEPWNGQDGVPIEDEIPLSEIMGDEF